jgi:soluble lytic murein transglycosylase
LPAPARWPPGCPPTSSPPVELERASTNPSTYLDRLPVSFAAQRQGRELALIALARLSRDDPMGAYTRYLGLNERFSAAERSYALGQIAWQAATRLMPDANPWFKAAGDTPMSEEQAAWRVRAALRAGDWRGVKAGVEAMPAEQRAARLDLLARPRPDGAGQPRRLAPGVRAHRRPPDLLRHPRRRGARARLHAAQKARALSADEAEQVRQTPACSARWPCSASRCAPKAPANGTGRCATGTTVS